MRRSTAHCMLALALGAGVAFGLDEASHVSDAGANPTSGSAVEQRLVWTFLDIQAGRLEDALLHTTRILEKTPDFELAHLVRGDLLLAMREPLAGFGSDLGREADVEGLREEAQARLARYLDAPPPRAIPAELVQLPPETQRAILIDTENYRLYLFAMVDGRLQRVLDFYVSIGKGGTDKQFEGDDKTPTGLYRIASYLPGSQLPDMYGLGAFPLDYPNGWDRLQGRTGSGIWIHGTESARYSRPPLSSRGCVTLSNEDFGELQSRIEVGLTPVILSRGVRWVSAESVRTVRDSIAQAVEQWRQDWESRDPDRYLSHYAPGFSTQGMSREAFSRHKRRVNPSKRYIKVGVEDIAMFGYPGEPAMVVVDFQQDYESDNFLASKKKRQFWLFEDGRWMIVYES